MLDFFIEHLLLPYYPEAKIGSPFRLKHNVDRFEIGAEGVTLVMARSGLRDDRRGRLRCSRADRLNSA